MTTISSELHRVVSSEMRAEAAVNLLRLFETIGIDVWLDGGWAVDAALGEQTRSHKDLDIILQSTDLLRLREILGARGFPREGRRHRMELCARGWSRTRS